MADEEHLKILQQGVDVWNEWMESQKNPELLRWRHMLRRPRPILPPESKNWREESKDWEERLRRARHKFFPDRSGADLVGKDLSGANFLRVNLTGAKLAGADLHEAVLYGADLRWANLNWTNLRGAVLQEANLTGTSLGGAILTKTDLTRANLSETYLEGALMVGTDLRGASLAGGSVYGASVWDIKVDDQTNQKDLVITNSGEPAITVDNIKVAQFIYLLLKNDEVRDVIDTITSKAVLILGRFSGERKAVLDAIRDELRNHNYLPIMFDFDPTANQTIIETVKTLAGMSRFVIADLTDARSVPQELQIIDTHCRTVAVRLIKKRGEPEYGMLDFRNSPWFVKGRCEYDSSEELIASIKENIILPAEAKVRELRERA